VSLSLTAWSLKIKALVRVHEICSKTKIPYLEQRIWNKILDVIVSMVDRLHCL
ncbi:hypothetical protein JMJ77_0002965, partial [Colletotrichum scovillei]